MENNTVVAEFVFTSADLGQIHVYLASKVQPTVRAQVVLAIIAESGLHKPAIYAKL